MRGLRRFSTMLVLGATALVAMASTGTHVQPSRFFATPIQHHRIHRRTPPARMMPEQYERGMHTSLVGR